MSRKPKKNVPKEPVVRRTPYQIPANIKEILKEHSAGYILVTIDYDGNYNFDQHFDNNIIAEAIELKTLKILQIKNEINDQNTLIQVLGPDHIDEDGGANGEEE